MKIKTKIISIVIFIILLIGIAVYANGPGRGSRGVYGIIDNGYVMMGGHGTGHGMMDWYGRSNDNRNRQSPRDYSQNRPTSRAEIESLRNQIQEKRRELSSLFRSDNVDKTEIEKKIEELSNLERSLDEKISSGN